MNHIIGGRSESIYGLVGNLLAQSEQDSPEVKKERKDRAEERRRHSLVLQNVCPTVECDGSLVRGKKNKKNDYKRDWTCKKCSAVYSY